MSYLMPNDYFQFIYKAIGLNPEQMANYFKSEYINRKENSPDFKNQLHDAIVRFGNLYKEKDNAPGLFAKDAEGKLIPLKGSSIPIFHFSEVFPNIHPAQDRRRVDENTISELELGNRIFTEISNEDIPNRNISKTKLNWKGNKNQLYNVLRQLKKDYELIGNSYNSLADFLIENVIGFETVSKETIEKELKKDQPLPKDKRVSINPNSDD